MLSQMSPSSTLVIITVLGIPAQSATSSITSIGTVRGDQRGEPPVGGEPPVAAEAEAIMQSRTGSGAK